MPLRLFAVIVSVFLFGNCCERTCAMPVQDKPVQPVQDKPVQDKSAGETTTDESRVSAKIPRATIQQWRRAFGNMEVSWFGIGSDGAAIGHPDKERVLERVHGRVIPIIETHGFKINPDAPEFPKVPDPETPFALRLNMMTIEGISLEGLKNWKSLEAVMLGGAVSNKNLREISTVESVELLGFSINKEVEGHVDNTGLQQLRKMSNLKHLIILGTVDDAMIETISEFPSIESLCFSNAYLLNDTTLASLKKLKNLNRIALSQSGIRGEKVEPLAELTGLKFLHIGSCRIGDEQLKKLAPLKELTHLTLFSNPLTDEGIEEILAFEKLTYLNFSDTKITAAGIKKLAALEHLEKVLLYGVELSEAETAEIKAALPKCKLLGVE